MSDWISVKDRKPKKEDSPILAISSFDSFSYMALQYIKGWDGWGWYDAQEEYGMSLTKEDALYGAFEGMKFWMPLPEPPQDG